MSDFVCGSMPVRIVLAGMQCPDMQRDEPDEHERQQIMQMKKRLRVAPSTA